jgi:cellulase/cellobiase CelA1
MEGDVMSLSTQIFFVVFSAIGMGTTLRLTLQMASAFLQGRSGKTDRQNVECEWCNPGVYLKGESK